MRPLHFARRQIGIGTIVDIREAASEPTDNVGRVNDAPERIPECAHRTECGAAHFGHWMAPTPYVKVKTFIRLGASANGIGASSAEDVAGVTRGNQTPSSGSP